MESVRVLKSVESKHFPLPDGNRLGFDVGFKVGLLEGLVVGALEGIAKTEKYGQCTENEI